MTILSNFSLVLLCLPWFYCSLLTILIFFLFVFHRIVCCLGQCNTSELRIHSSEGETRILVPMHYKFHKKKKKSVSQIIDFTPTSFLWNSVHEHILNVSMNIVYFTESISDFVCIFADRNYSHGSFIMSSNNLFVVPGTFSESCDSCHKFLIAHHEICGLALAFVFSLFILPLLM